MRYLFVVPTKYSKSHELRRVWSMCLTKYSKSHELRRVSEVSLDETMLGSIYDLRASSRKSKKTSERKNNRSRKVSKPNKSPKVSR